MISPESAQRAQPTNERLCSLKPASNKGMHNVHDLLNPLRVCARVMYMRIHVSRAYIYVEYVVQVVNIYIYQTVICAQPRVYRLSTLCRDENGLG